MKHKFSSIDQKIAKLGGLGIVVDLPVSNSSIIQAYNDAIEICTVAMMEVDGDTMFGVLKPGWSQLDHVLSYLAHERNEVLYQ